MRLVPVGLVLALLGIFFVPAVSASSQKAACRISLRHPTSPQWSDSCTSVPWDVGTNNLILHDGENDSDDQSCSLHTSDCQVAFSTYIEVSPDGASDERLNVSAEAWIGNSTYEVVVVG